MKVNDLRSIHIIFTVYCVWPLCTARAGNYVSQTARTRPEQTFYVHENRLAVMYRLAVHNVTTAARAIVSRLADD